ncbi:MAG: flagellar biosynthesis anti-sigma factor FlgM [Planctomycetota bacterium]|jgi:negative regulator of flagellin synthesis FlgM
MDVNGIGPISGGQPIRRINQPVEQQKSQEARPVSPKDELELSSVDSASAEVELQNQFRAQRLEQIRQEIEAGTYETPEKLDAAVNRMLEELLAE